MAQPQVRSPQGREAAVQRGEAERSVGAREGGKASEVHKVGETISVRWVKSQIGFDKRQRATLRGLGFRRLNQRVQLQDTPAIRGMIFKVRHLVVVEEA